MNKSNFSLHALHTKPSWSALAVIALAITIGIPSGVRAGSDCGTWWVHETELQVGQTMPDFGFATCEGEEMTTSELQGKPALINFWATWCGPCVKELTHFSELAREQGADLHVVGVSVDASAKDVRKFLKRKQLDYTLAWDSGDIASDLGITSIPVTIAVDAKGRVAAVHHGYASAAQLRELLNAAQAGAS
jgi:cytochrome c biogenesis protein CcmG, thiol:disulfide interchange protein DsbE